MRHEGNSENRIGNSKWKRFIYVFLNHHQVFDEAQLRGICKRNINKNQAVVAWLFSHYSTKHQMDSKKIP